MNIFVKIILKVLLLPVFIILAFFKYVIKWFGAIGIIILRLLSGICLVAGTIFVFFAWKEGILKTDFSYILIFVMGFGFSVLSVVVAIIPASLEIACDKLLTFLFS